VDNGRQRGGLRLSWGVHFHGVGRCQTRPPGRTPSSGVSMMTMNDWDWPGQLETCQRKIAELEQKIASQRQNVQRLLDCNMNAIFAQRILAMREESLRRVQGHKHLIETRIADRARRTGGTVKQTISG
jgi:hypothetical protein